MGGLDNALWIDRAQYILPYQHSVPQEDQSLCKAQQDFQSTWVDTWKSVQAKSELLSGISQAGACWNVFPLSKLFRVSDQFFFGENMHGF